MKNSAFFKGSKRTQLNPKRTQFFDPFGDIWGEIRANKGSFGALLAYRGPIVTTGRVLFDPLRAPALAWVNARHSFNGHAGWGQNEPGAKVRPKVTGRLQNRCLA